MDTRMIRIAWLSLLCIMLFSAAHAASTVQGRIYLKDGRTIECGKEHYA